MRSYPTFSEIRNDLKLGKLSCQQLVTHYLKNIEDNKHLNAFIEVYKEEALAKAREVDQKIKNNKAGELAGLVFGIKDLLCFEEHRVSGGSKILQDFESQFSSTAVQALLSKDAIVIGRQNCDEFGMGSSNENSAYGPVRNQADLTRVPGGSSGGSAVAVQADMCQVSLGTDTGGSVRQPAAFCGVVGLKPTYSRISRWGLLAYASSFDTIGVFSKSVEDSALVLQTIAGADGKDGTASSLDVPKYIEEFIPDKKYKIAYLPEALESEALQPEIKEAINTRLHELAQDGHEVVPVSFPMLQKVLPAYYILTTAEASANLARYDGAHYGHRSQEATDLDAFYKNSRTEGFGEEVRRRIMLGTFVLSADYYDAYYTKAQKVRRLIQDATNKILGEYDFIVIPTTPTTAFKLGEHSQDPLEMYLADLYTVQASVTGVPSISLPIGKDSKNLPIGIQIMTKAFDEAKLFAFSKVILNEQ